MTDSEEIAALLEDMRSGDENRLIGASPMLAQFGAAAVPGLLSTLENDQPLVRDYSAWSLGMIGATAELATSALCHAARDEVANVRYAAIVALGRIGKPTAEIIDCLNSALSDPDSKNQRGARNALDEIKAASSGACSKPKN